jgi:hypothetical protein
MLCAVAISIASGLTLAPAVHASGAAATALFAIWLAGPLIAGAVLRTTRLWPYLVVGFVWFAMIPLSASLGLIATAAGAASDATGQNFVATFTLFALPLTAPVVAVFSFLAGFGARLLEDRRSDHGVED